MSATNSRIAKLNKAKAGLEFDYAAHKADWTPEETAYWDNAVTAIGRLIVQEKKRRVS